MERNRRFATPATRLVFWGYAAVAWTGGFLLSAWGPMWFGVDLAGMPLGKAALIRLAGAAIVAAGCFAAAMTEVPDSDALQRGMLWFAGGHAVLWLMVLLQQIAIWNSPLGETALVVLFIPILAFLLLRGDLDPRASPIENLFGTGDRVAKNGVSRREREIRESAGREERNRLARDLHDSIKQQLFAIQTAAATAQTRFDPDPEGARGAIAQVRAAAREAMTEMEVMLDQLRAAPLENVGLVEALKRQCEAVGFRTGAKVAFTLGKLPPDAALPPGAQQAIFRVGQEALSNVARHARAVNLRVTLASVEGSLRLSVEDDGAGFDPEAPATGMGVRNMRERAAEFGGTFELASRLGGGTRLAVAVPFALPSTEEQYLKRAGAEALGLLLMLVIAIFLHSGVSIGMALLFAVRFVRALLAWYDFRASREAVR
jgi:signal transduction histidine kinase